MLSFKSDEESKKLASTLLVDYLNYCKSLPQQDLTIDKVRLKSRWEMLAAAVHLSSLLSAEVDSPTAERWSNLLVSGQRETGFWPECGYAVDDENYGPDGTVTTSFAIMALSHRLNSSMETEACLLKACDAIYRSENNGSIVKSSINKSDVLNTNLLAATALLTIANRLKQNSARKRLYTELSRRVIRNSLSYQLPSGIFPYHHHSKAQPLLYHAMVLALLCALQRTVASGTLQLSIQRGRHALGKMLGSDGLALWESANNHDKTGAIWFYSFALASGLDPSISSMIVIHLKKSSSNELLITGDGAKQEDFFYTAWATWGLSGFILNNPPEVRIKLVDHLKFFIFSCIAVFRYVRFLAFFICNYFSNFIFFAGAGENKIWIKK